MSPIVKLSFAVFSIIAGLFPAGLLSKPLNKQDVQITQAWVRPTVKGQMGTGGFMSLTSTKGAILLGFKSPVAQSAQLHEMAMVGDVMQMREVPQLALPAKQTVSLAPGGHHLMLIGLKKTLNKGELIPLEIKFKSADGRVFEQTIEIPVSSSQP